MNPPYIVAHRGASAAERENTLPAFEQAIALGADMVEFDVRRTLDGVLVVHHDAHIEAPAGTSPQAIASCPWSVLQQVAPYLPTLDTVLQTCAGRIQCDVELKEMGYEAEAIALVQQYLAPTQVVLTSFHPPSVQTIKAIAPGLQVGWLVDDESLTDWQIPMTEPWWERVLPLKADFIAPHHSLISSELLTWATAQAIPIWTWTVNEVARMRSLLLTPQIAAIITDHPESILPNPT
jgi:glycerophosphoryl diester phosphodiesterase